jgi:hypothetical protein
LAITTVALEAYGRLPGDDSGATEDENGVFRYELESSAARAVTGIGFPLPLNAYPRFTDHHGGILYINKPRRCASKAGPAELARR